MRMHTVLIKTLDHIADFNLMSRLEATDQDVVMLHDTESPPGLIQDQLSFNLVPGFSVLACVWRGQREDV